MSEAANLVFQWICSSSSMWVLLTLHYKNSFSSGLFFLKFIYTIKKLHDYELMRAVKRSELKRCSK